MSILSVVETLLIRQTSNVDTHGVRYQVRSFRIAEVFDVPEALVADLLPPEREQWGFKSGRLDGYTGYLKNQHQGDRFAEGLLKAQRERWT